MTGTQSGLKFDLEWRITLFTVLLVPLMIGLGFWQLQRAQEKSVLAAAFEARQKQAPAPLATLWDQPASVLGYVPVEVSGTFLPDQYFLLDNRISGGKFGYEVLGILQLGQGGSVLVNRGWIAGDGARLVLPQVPEVTGEVEIKGHVYVSPGKPYLLEEQQLELIWPMTIQAVEMDKLGPAVQALGIGELFPYPVRIDAGEPAALSVDWQIVNMSPQKHQGYAVQWFVMAIVLFGFYLLRSSNVLQLLRGSERTRH